jgi:hypothetical protein
MNSFIEQLIERHTTPSMHVKPRIRGWFESDTVAANSLEESAKYYADEKEANAITAFDVPKLQRSKNSVVKESSTVSNIETDITNKNTVPLEEQKNEAPANQIFQNKSQVKPDVYKPPFKDVKDVAKGELGRLEAETKNKNTFIKTETETQGVFITKKTNTAETNEAKPGDFLIDRSVKKALISAESPGLSKRQHAPGSLSTTYPLDTKEAADKTTIIKVNIGRIDVRAVVPTSVQSSSDGKKENGPRMSLDDYFKKRNKGNS